MSISHAFARPASFLWRSRCLTARPVLQGIVSLCLCTQIACGGAEDQQAANPAESSAGTGGTGSGGSGGSAAQTKARNESTAVDKTFWHHDFEVAVASATLTVIAGAESGELSIDTTMENTVSTDARFDARLLLTDGQKDYTMRAPDGMPLILGSRSQEVTLTATVDPDFDLDRATLIVGSPANAQATVPIGEDSPDEYFSLESQSFEVDGKMIAGSVGVALLGGNVQANAGGGHTEVDKDHLYVWLEYTASFEAGGTNLANFVPRNFMLVPAGGKGVAGDAGGNTILLESDARATEDLWVRFTVPKPFAGPYELVFQGPYAAGNKDVEARLEIEIPEMATFPE